MQNMESTMNLSTWLTDGAVITKLRDTFLSNYIYILCLPFRREKVVKDYIIYINQYMYDVV